MMYKFFLERTDELVRILRAAPHSELILLTEQQMMIMPMIVPAMEHMLLQLLAAKPMASLSR